MRGWLGVGCWDWGGGVYFKRNPIKREFEKNIEIDLTSKKIIRESPLNLIRVQFQTRIREKY